MIPIEENSASESEIATWNFMCVFNYFTSLIIKENKLHSYPHISVTKTSKS